MGDEIAPGSNVRLLEPGDCQFRHVDLPDDVRLAVRAGIEGVVSLLPVVLQRDERFGEVVDFRWKLPHCPALQAGTSGPAMLKGAIRPVPRRTLRSADEQVGRGSRQTMKHPVIRGADRSAKPRLSEASAVCVRQAPCGFHQLMRVQGCASPSRTER